MFPMTTAYPCWAGRGTPEAFQSSASWSQRWEDEVGGDTWISSTGFTLHVQLFCKLKKRRSQSLYTEHMFCHRARAWLGYSLAMAVSQYGSTPFDLLPLTNNNHQQQYNCNDHNGTHSPIHSTPHQRRRRRKYRRTWVSLSLSCDLSLSRINTLLHHHALWYCGRDSQTSRLINIMFRRISTWLQWQPICGKEIQ